jgi:hypothetical protein
MQWYAEVGVVGLSIHPPPPPSRGERKEGQGVTKKKEVAAVRRPITQFSS